MFRKAIYVLGVFSFLFSLSGCATMGKKSDLQMQGLKNQISALEAQLQEKNREISNLKEALSSKPEMEERAVVKPHMKKKAIGEIKARPKINQVQIALKNAGYNPGAIDGKMGKETRDAIRAFQRANNLNVDGRIGKETWGLLRNYLYDKAK
jgi:peptidoglycan hydrolase-like protein with peptidoglycan-binding domain